MKSAIFFVLLLSAFVCASQQFFFIDDFTEGVNAHSASIKLTTDITSSANAQSVRSFLAPAGCDSSSLIGCGRALKIVVNEASTGRTFNSDILTSETNTLGFVAEWAIAAPKNTKSIYYVTYDGASDDGGVVNTSGLGAVDFTANGGEGLQFYLVADLNATYTVQLYSTGGTCASTITIPPFVDTTYTRDDIDRQLPFSSFTGNCNKAAVGAVVLTIESADAVDALVREVSVYGTPLSASPSPSPSPSRSIALSNSASNTPAASDSPSPSRSATPSPSVSGPCVQFCTCPAFTCQMMYDVDDDVNDVSTNLRTSLFFFDDGDSDDVDSVTPSPVVTQSSSRSLGSTATPTRTPVAVVDNGSSSGSGSSGASELVISAVVLMFGLLVAA